MNNLKIPLPPLASPSIFLPGPRPPRPDRLEIYNLGRAAQIVGASACGTAMLVSAATTPPMGFTLGGAVLLYGGLFVALKAAQHGPVMRRAVRRSNPAP